MTKKQAKLSGFCKHCAAFWGNRQNCRPSISKDCKLPDDVIKRWQLDYRELIMTTNDSKIED